jgi:hypothetical protein
VNPNTNLSAAIKARDNAAVEVTAIGAKLAKLETALSATSPAVAELAQLRADAHTAALAWNGEGDLPTVDHKQEARLRDEVNAFESSKRSAQDAVKTLDARRAAAQRAQAEANKRAELAALSQLLAEEDPRQVEEIRAIAQAYVNAVETRTTFRRFILTEANRHGDIELNLAAERSYVTFETPVGVADLDGINARLRDLLTGEVEAL